ncbi:MAG: hypothetical protein IPF92_04410 [Myxococcales bacterium]|nr:hypothetical protein [Myxococcales bacterium]
MVEGRRVPATLDTVLGQATALETLRRALATGRTHHAYLFDGPEGVGKERAAFGLAQCLVCERPSAGLACGSCSACGRAVPAEPGGLPLHPDIAVLGRGLYEPAQIGRKTPESREISIDQVRTIVLSRAAFPPHEGRARVFIVRAADELGVSAANALLKTLEEPHRATTFVLLTARKGSLLSTIRSRALALRFGALPLAVVAEVLVAGGLAPEAAGARGRRLGRQRREGARARGRGDQRGARRVHRPRARRDRRALGERGVRPGRRRQERKSRAPAAARRAGARVRPRRTRGGTRTRRGQPGGARGALRSRDARDEAAPRQWVDAARHGVAPPGAAGLGALRQRPRSSPLIWPDSSPEGAVPRSAPRPREGARRGARAAAIRTWSARRAARRPCPARACRRARPARARRAAPRACARCRARRTRRRSRWSPRRALPFRSVARSAVGACAARSARPRAQSTKGAQRARRGRLDRPASATRTARRSLDARKSPGRVLRRAR